VQIQADYMGTEAEKALARALAAYRLNAPQEALGHAEAVRRMGRAPDDAWALAYVLKGLALWHMDRGDEALTIFKDIRDNAADPDPSTPLGALTFLLHAEAMEAGGDACADRADHCEDLVYSVDATKKALEAKAFWVKAANHHIWMGNSFRAGVLWRQIREMELLAGVGPPVWTPPKTGAP
jgi:hypothetical protein